MEFVDKVAALFPMVATTAIIIRYLVEFGKRYFDVVADNPGRVQAILNALAWLGMGLAAHYGVEGEVLDVVRHLTDALPGLLGLVELMIPTFFGILATFGAHRLLKQTEGKPVSRPQRVVG